jgi:molybdopterin synthase catalytic subunit
VTVRVRLFAILRERAGHDSVALELPAGATVADAVSAVAEETGLGELLGRMSLGTAVNRQYVPPDTELRPGDELALIPPVSGGAPLHARVGDEPLRLDALSRAVTSPRAGAIVIFQGTTREVEALEYEAYTEMAEKQIATILAECVQRHGLEGAAAEHRVGRVPLGEPSVIVAVSAEHRAEAFAGAREAIDRIKEQVPIWKREVSGQDGSWVNGLPVQGAARPARGGQGGVSQRPLTHVDEHGDVRMVDVADKQITARVARAGARVRMSAQCAQAVQAASAPKGEVLATARLAGIQAAKRTDRLIPLAHTIGLTFADVRATVDVEAGLVELVSEMRTVGRTGVEMEAMTACAVAALTVYDMIKGIERGVQIEHVVLLEKRGGRNDWVRADDG